MNSIEIVSPVAQVLQQVGVPFRVLRHAKAALTCEAVAAECGVPLSEMVKCMILFDRSTERHFIVAIPADKRLSMKKSEGSNLVEELRNHSIRVHSSDCITRMLSSFVDSTLLKKRQLNINSGDPTYGLELSAWDFRKIYAGRFVDVKGERKAKRPRRVSIFRTVRAVHHVRVRTAKFKTNPSFDHRTNAASFVAPRQPPLLTLSTCRGPCRVFRPHEARRSHIRNVLN